MISIFVGNLDYNVEEHQLRSLFERHGRVAEVRIVTDQTTQRRRGFAFVRMPSLDDADEAINSLSGAMLNGRPLTVNESQDRQRSTSAEQSAGRGSERAEALELFDNLCRE